ncbi:hypothetical protein Q3G72_020816 [Acer saccharum]|nr:hypothetical protein Q3G72_020816 [Acer saccharum]
MHVKLEHGCLLVNQLVHHEDIIWKALLSEKACLIQGRYCCLNLYLLAIVYCSWSAVHTEMSPLKTIWLKPLVKANDAPHAHDELIIVLCQGWYQKS